MRTQILDKVTKLLLALCLDVKPLRLEFPTHHDMRSRLVNLAVVAHITVFNMLPLSGLPHETPAGHDIGGVDHVFLGVAAVRRDGVELQQLARVVLVQPLWRLALSFPIDIVLRGRASRPEIVEALQHRPRDRDVMDKIGKAARHALPDDVALHRAGVEYRQLVLVDDGEMVAPEMPETLEDGRITIDRLIMPNGQLI